MDTARGIGKLNINPTSGPPQWDKPPAMAREGMLWRKSSPEPGNLLAAMPRGDPDRELTEFAPPGAQFAWPQGIVGTPALCFAPGKLFLGISGGAVQGGAARPFVSGGTPLGVMDDRHMMTVAGSRAGKGRGVIVPNMLLYAGSVLATDPKGELAALTARHRAQRLKQAVHILDPFGVTPERLRPWRAAFNPLAGLSAGDDPAIVGNAAMIADALVVAGGKDPHWDESARAFIEGLLLHVATWPAYDGNRHMVTVRRLLARGAEGHDPDTFAPVHSMRLLEDEMRANGAAFGIVQSAAADFFDRPDNERDSVLSTARRHLKFLDLPELAGVLEGHDFELADLKSGAVTVYLCLPARHMDTCSRWLRLFVNLTLQAMESTPGRPALPVLFCLDEFHILGPMRQIETAAAQIAGFGVKLWPVLQDLGQLKALYGERWETFMGNAGVLQFFGNNDLTTLEWISKRLGKTSIRTRRDSPVTSEQQRKGATGESWATEVHDLLTPEEVARFFSGTDAELRQLVIIPGLHPLVLRRAWYDTHELFRGLADVG